MPSHLLSLNPNLNPQIIEPATSYLRCSNSTMSQSTPTSDLKTYNGNCHCGAFKCTVKLPKLTTFNECNCSICFKRGYKVCPEATDFIITKGEGTLKEYRFGPGRVNHRFCPTCGTGIVRDMEDSPGPGLNLNTIQDLDLDLFDLKVYTNNGEASEPQYATHKFAGTEPTAEIENAKTYYGGCHCGDVTVAMKIEGSLTDDKPPSRGILECDCSICTKDGTILTYPLKDAFSVHTSSSTALTTYVFGRQLNEHKFCSNCGVSVYIHKKEHVPEEYWRKYRGDESQERWRRTQPVNLRCFEGVEWDVLREKGLIERGDWSKVDPKYVVPE